MSDIPKPAILIIADLFFTSKLKGDVLAAGYEYKAALGVKTALKRAEDYPLAAIVIELSKQNLDYEALIIRLRDEPSTADVPLIGFCGHMDTNRLHRAEELGCKVVCSNGQISGDFQGVLKTALGA